MTASVLTKPKATVAAMPSAMPLVLQPPRHLPALPLLLTPGEYSVGTDPSCDLVVAAEGVAPQHAHFVVNHFGVGLQALDARTWVNDFPVTATTLRRGDRISLGPLTLTLRPATADDLLMQVSSLDLDPVTEPDPVILHETVEAPGPALEHSLDQTLAQVEADLAAIKTEELGPAVEAPVLAEPVVEDDDAGATVVVASIEEVLPTAAPQVISRTALDEDIAAWQAERAAQEQRLVEWNAELAALAAGLEEREARFSTWENRLDRREQSLDHRQSEIDAQRTALDEREAALTDERVRLERTATTARAELAAEVEKQSAAWHSWEETQRRLSTELNDQFTALHAVEAELATAKGEFAAEQESWRKVRATGETERAEWDARRQEQQLQLAEWEVESSTLAADLTKQREHLESQRAELHAESCQRAAAHRELFESRQELQREWRLLSEQQSAWMAERETQWIDLRERRRRLDADEREIAELHQQAREALLAADTATTKNIIAESAETTVEGEPSASPSASSAFDLAHDTAMDDAGVSESEMVDATASPAMLAEVREVVLSEESRVDAVPLEEAETVLELHDIESEHSDSESASALADEPVALDRLEIAAEHFAETYVPEDVAVESSEIAAAWPPSAVSEPQADSATRDEGVDSIPHQDEVASVEELSEDNLHSQLAKMFGLPDDFGHSTDESSTVLEVESLPQQEATTDVASTEGDESTVATAEVDDASDATTDDANDAWRQQLAQMLAAPPPKKSEPEPVVPAETAAASVPAERVAEPSLAQPVVAPSPPPEEDSIAAYMERLLARNRMGSSSPSTPVTAERTPAPTPTQPVIHTPAVVAALPTVTSPSTDVEANVESPAEPLPEIRPRADKDEVRATLQSFRQVANLSARSALAKHGTKTLRGEIAIQGTLAGLAAIAAGAYWSGPLWGSTAQPLQGTGCLIAAGWMGWQISRTLHRLQNWNPNDRLEVQDREDDGDAPTLDAMPTVTDQSDALLPTAPADRPDTESFMPTETLSLPGGDESPAESTTESVGH